MPTSITSSGITFDDATTQTTSATKAGGIGTTQLANSSVTPAKLSQPYTLDTAKASTSGTSIDFTDIPSWAKRITVMLSGVSTNGTSNPQVQIGAGSVTSTGYSCACSGYQNTSSGGTQTSTSGFVIVSASASATLFGSIVIENITGNTWAATIVVGSVGTGVSFFGGGSVVLSGTLDRVRVTTVNGTDTFDAGTVNISYEG